MSLNRWLKHVGSWCSMNFYSFLASKLKLAHLNWWPWSYIASRAVAKSQLCEWSYFIIILQLQWSLDNIGFDLIRNHAFIALEPQFNGLNNICLAEWEWLSGPLIKGWSICLPSWIIFVMLNFLLTISEDSEVLQNWSKSTCYQWFVNSNHDQLRQDESIGFPV